MPKKKSRAKQKIRKIHARRAALLMQATDEKKADPKSPDDLTVYLLTSRADLSSEEMLSFKRSYWDIENGAHQRLDCSRLQEDKSRVRTRNNARKATTNGFIAAMRKDGSELAFRLVTSKSPNWLPSKVKKTT